MHVGKMFQVNTCTCKSLFTWHNYCSYLAYSVPATSLVHMAQSWTRHGTVCAPIFVRWTAGPRLVVCVSQSVSRKEEQVTVKALVCARCLLRLWTRFVGSWDDLRITGQISCIQMRKRRLAVVPGTSLF